MPMMTLNGKSSRILRTGTINGRVPGVDPRIQAALSELNTLLEARLFEPPRAVGAPRVARAVGAVAGLDLDATLKLRLQPRRPDKPNPAAKKEWEKGTLAFVLDEKRDELANARPPVAGLMSFSELITDNAAWTLLADDFATELREVWWTLDFNTRTVLGPSYPAVRDYLIVLGAKEKRITKADELVSFVTNNASGARRIVDYAVISAAREWIKSENLQIDFRQDGDNVVTELRAARLPFGEDEFVSAVDAVVTRTLNRFGTSATARIGRLVDAHAALFPERFRSALIEHLKRAPVKITAANVEAYIPFYVQQIAGGILATGDEPTTEQSDRDFTVDFFAEDRELVSISRSSVKAAAQLYYTMILGDELQVFDVVNFFTHKYLVGRGFEISDPKLRRDLQMYVFSNQFTTKDSITGAVQIVDRTQPAERHMFYRQVFNYGAGQVTEDVIVNGEFGQLWKVLMLESAKYLERIQISPNPDTRVSRQNVMQAVEDLQYNLSLHSTGMATVMTPLIYDELDFVIRRILMHEEVRKQVSPSGGSWWKVVETLYEGMRHVRPRATALNNKARLGHSILRAIAEYDPQPFEQDDVFFPFISDVEAFITTQSILQEGAAGAPKAVLDEEGEDEYDEEPIAKAPPTLPAGVGGGTPAQPAGEWDF